MSAFRYEAVDAHGHVRQGVLDADNVRGVLEHLRAGGLTPTAVDPAPEPGKMLSRARLPAAALALLTQQLATLVQSGMPLDQSLVAVAAQADGASVAKL